MSDVEKQRCEFCRFWGEDLERHTAECRRRAPMPVMTGAVPPDAPDATGTSPWAGEMFSHAWWPRTFADDWCGDWEYAGRSWLDDEQ